MSKSYRLIAIEGEGIGPEVVDASLKIIQYVASLEGFDLNVNYAMLGEVAFNKLGSPFPKETQQLCENADGILFGAVTGSGLLELRQHFDFFINLRPIRIIDSLVEKSSLKSDKVLGLDILIVRELVSGIYFGSSGRGEDYQGIYGYHTMKYYDWEIRRIARVALELAQRRQGLLTVVHKENALPHLPWSHLVLEEAKNFPNVVVQSMLVDNLAMQLVLNPTRFDVIVAGNLFGDILSDIGGALMGSVGLLTSASFNAQGFGLYEAVHGTAPDIVGKGIANPLGTLGSAILCLEQWGEYNAAKRIIQAQEKILAQGYRTADLNPHGAEILVNTEELVQLFLQELGEEKRACN
ncbi:3-isopropylmalate dehydrogenase [Dapis sp. BLCC M229]|uniref:3-isopropylmalate dehydrogenase n=1 Tax=Dapis sp. BLCC M229 TaxID=3400188 RepID=UPI003CEC43C6